jgi:Ala-tRNA(Pro) deacylase
MAAVRPGSFPQLQKEMVMPAQQLREFLNEQGVKYATIIHSPAFTAQEIAASAHVPGIELAKTVIVEMDGKMAMAVLPASYRVNLDELKEAAGASAVKLACEKEFADLFPGCEIGAMPPFGNLYNMDVYVAPALAEDEYIAFNAGSHTELIRLEYADFERLVKPKVIEFAAVR